AAPQALPEIARWQDFADNTAYAVHTKSSDVIGIESRASANLFTFTTPAGDQVLGLLPLVQQKDLSYLQTTSSDPSILSGCTGGLLAVSRETSAASTAGAAGTPTTTGVEYSLLMHMDQYGLVAYAEILYAPVSDEAAAGSVCKGNPVPGVTHLVMSSGCDAKSCTSPLDAAASAPPQYESALLAAMTSRSEAAWSAVYNQTSHLITKQFS